MGDQKGFSIVFGMVVLMSFVSSLSIFPRVTRTSDSIIIDCKDHFLFKSFEY